MTTNDLRGTHDVAVFDPVVPSFTLNVRLSMPM